MILLHRGEQRRSNRIGARLAVALAIDHIGPPLHADFTRQGRVCNLTNARNLSAKGVERVQCAAPLGRSKQRSDKAIAVGSPDKLGAIGECILHGRTLASERQSLQV